MRYNMKHIFIAVFGSLLSFMVSAQETMRQDSINKAEQEVNVLYGTQKYGRFVGNMSAVEGDKLTSYPSLTVNEALAGRLPGLFIMQNSASPGENDFNNYVRGSVGGYITLVDGVERSLTTYDIEQIEEIRLLKDPVSKALYGGRMTNGILMVTTKRGKEMKSEFKVNVQGGIKMPTKLPKYLNAYDFATKYNEALANDGLTVGQYSQQALDAYRNGSNPYQYPDVDYYDEFLNKTMQMLRMNVEYYGGSERTRYFIHGGFQNEGGLEAYGDKKTRINSFNLQSNLDTRFSDQILLHANFIGYVAERQAPGNFNISTLSSRYPNAYPIFVGTDSVGGTSSWRDNPYAGQAQSGYIKSNEVRIQADLGLEFKLDAITPGLSIKPAYSMDIFHIQNLNKISRPAIYSIASYDEAGNPVTFNTIQTEQPATNQSMGDSEYINHWALNGMLSYARRFGNHEVDADLIYYLSKQTTANVLLEYKRQNLGLRANYTYASKYSIEGVLNYTGSQSYDPDNRFKLYPAVGLGWLISGEGFMKDASWIDFLKLNGSWGVMGDGDIEANYWRESWGLGSKYYFNNSVSHQTTQLNQVANYGMDWPKQREFDISLEANIFKKIYGKISYFDYLQLRLLSKRVNMIPSIIGGESFLPYTNFGKTGLKGMEFELSYATKINNDWSIKVGSHVTYSKSEKVLIDEVPDPNYSTQGTAWDDIRGYKAVGFYTQEEVDRIQAGTSDLPVPSYMDSKSLKAGNIKYLDVNKDGVLDKYDTQVIGNSLPRLMYGLDLTLKYKGFELSAVFLGYGQFDRLLNTSYYQVYSTRKYSDIVVDGLPNGNPHPRLTTGSATNDIQTSDYWIVNGSFLKLKNAAFSYTLPDRMSKAMLMKSAKFTLYGTNLLSFSKIKDSDPESLNAGVSMYPLFQTIALGFSATF